MNPVDLEDWLRLAIAEKDRMTVEELRLRLPDFIPRHCEFTLYAGHLIINCVCRPPSEGQEVWRSHAKLTQIEGTITRITVFSSEHCYSISLEEILNDAPPQDSRLATLLMNASMTPPMPQGNVYRYCDLFVRAALSTTPTYITEVPRNWHWGQPQRVILSSASVSEFSGLKAPRWHNQDVTRLYRREVFEVMHQRLVQELEGSRNGLPAILSDYEYFSYRPDVSRSDLSQSAGESNILYPGEEKLFVSDVELAYVEDLNTFVRICSCKSYR